MKKIVFLASGGGGTAKFIQQCIQYYSVEWEISAILADRACGAIEFAQKYKIPHQIVDYSQNDPNALRHFLLSHPSDFIITNFHRIIDKPTLEMIPGMFINVHYSLLPAFAGLIGMQTLKQAKKKNVLFVGASCHKVVAKVDDGILFAQVCFPAKWETMSDQQRTNLMFRAGCLSLLSALCQYSKIPTSLTEIAFENENILQVEPGAPNFELSNSAFWEAVRNT